MRLLFLMLLGCSLHSFGQKTSGFEINGRIHNAEGKKIYIASTAQAVPLDSAVIQNGTFVLRGKLKEPDYYALVVEGKSAYTWFVLSNEKLTFIGNADSMRQASISGSKELADGQKLRAIIKPYFATQSAAFDSAFNAYNRGDSITGRIYEDMNVALTRIINDSIASFIKKQPSSFISLGQLKEVHQSIGGERAKELFLSLSTSLQNHSIGRQLKYQLFEAAQLTALNKKAITFEQKDTVNKTVRLADYKGKYVLIDFWASWCLPCRAENPNLKQAYGKYNGKGFEILGVSLDNNKASWLNAIRKDELPWTNVSDLNGFKNTVAQKYAVTELPTNYLLDPQGKIIAKNLKGNDLLETLKSLFGE